MTVADKQEFLDFLAECLMYDEEPLTFDGEMPEQVFDSVGKLMVASAIENHYGASVSMDNLIACRTPGEIYALLLK